MYVLTGLESAKFVPSEPLVLPLETSLFQRPAHWLGSTGDIEVREDQLGSHAAECYADIASVVLG